MNPLKVKASATPITSANFSGLQPMTDAEVKNYIANIITEKFAADTNGTGTAELNIDTANLLSGTSIGNFVDTKRTEAIGTHPATGATTSTTYYAKQVTSAAAESITNRPIKWDSNTKELDDTDVDGVMDLVIDAMVSESAYTAGQYKLQASTPSGGTWVARYTITDEAAGGNTTTYLWQKTVATSSADSDLTPLKSNNANSIKQMSVAEIEQMVPNFRNRIIDTSIGTYKFQSSTPGTGTWVQMGDAFSDTRQSIAEVAYVDGAGYTGAYSNNFTNVYTNQYTKTYSQDFAGTYGAGAFSGDYTGVYTSISPVAQFGGNYDGASYTSGPTNVAYSGEYGGASYTSGPTNVVYSGEYSAQYSGEYTNTYSGEYTGFYATGYTNTYTGLYSREYTSEQPTSIGYASGLPPQAFISPVQFTRQYTGQYNRQYTAEYSGGYTGEFNRVYSGSYVNTYTGEYTKQYSGPAYAGIYSSDYSRVYTGPAYTKTYSGTYSTIYTGEFAGTYAGTYGAGTFSGAYTGEYNAQYSGEYSTQYSGEFAGTYGAGASYSGDTVQATKDTVANVKLWIRTA